MPSRSQDALATLLLANRLIESDADPLSPREFWQLVDVAPSPSELLGKTERELSELGVANAPRAMRLLDASTRLAFELERLEAQGFTALTPWDDAYPHRLRERLRTQAPPVIFAVGNIDLLATEGIGVVGSRNVSEAGARVAEEAATMIADSGLTLLSGGARGVDQRSMNAAHHHGGNVLAYLAESLDRRVRAPDTRRAIGSGTVCLATVFKPSAGFSVGSAMARNKLIYGSARTTFVVATDADTGGTWAGATEAIRRRYGHVSVWRGEGEGPGNEALERAGAWAITRVEEILQPVEAPSIPEPAEREQLTLDL
jgi:predicted Rossmann fold nucleotide-binding protein DprA/Smf involved in DNA uptake